MQIALAQINPIVGDLEGNANHIIEICREAANQNADLVLTPELSLWGYPPRDLLLNPILLDKQNQSLNEITKTLKTNMESISVVIGIAEKTFDTQIPSLFNSLVLVDSSGWKVIARKQLLPTYDVFDEKRYFRAGNTPAVMKFRKKNQTWTIGLTICEDLWVDKEIQGQRLEGPDPIEKLIKQDIDLLCNLSASPYGQSKLTIREQLVKQAALRLRCPVIYLNQVGANDELIFDGASFVINKLAQTVLKLPSCKEALVIFDPTNLPKKSFIPSNNSLENLFRALVLGVRDYAFKCHFNSALVGLSGGIDSALVAVIASAALGSKHVKALMMPSPWSSSGSIDDAQNLIKKLGMPNHLIPINNLIENFESTLTQPLGKPPEGITAENLQSRIRGIILMALANQEGHLLLSTGNKSELAVGYCTLYGDMNGGLSVIGDLYKTSVFELCEWIDSDKSNECLNELGLPSNEELITKAIRHKPPSAELRPNQLDTDSLPEYALLDPLLKALIETRLSPNELEEHGYNRKLIEQIQKLVRKGEFKRRQAPPLLKVSPQAFGSGWRVPIASA